MTIPNARKRHRSCLVRRFGGKLVLVVHSESKVLVADSNRDTVSVVDQSEAMWSSYLRKAREEVESKRDGSLA